ncbi:transposase [Solitalea koreensis]|uniref:Transposase IS200 like n=1 Tax=Solitalea koreensis TaxID=543615 RepID=A0A521B1P7_9SPHI|nr:transposase [Solitalea koreensis]SMO40951.1 Transposase IS200 like [Solitalea koreensis]
MTPIDSKKQIRLIFTMKDISALELESWCDELLVRIADMVCEAGHKLLAINCTLAEIHVFIEMFNEQHLNDLINEIKETNINWLNRKTGIEETLEWESGFQSELYPVSQMTRIISQIHNLRGTRPV